MIRVSGFFACLLFLASPHLLIALDPNKTLTQYVHNVWQIEQGLPQNSVYAILQSHDGYLWVGTEEGLVRFDGVRLKVFDKTNTVQLKSNRISSLLEDHQGNLWIGTARGGLSRYKDGKFTAYTTKDGLLKNSVWSLCEDHTGNVWIGTEQGLNRYRDGKFTAYTTKDGLSNGFVNSLYEDRQGSLWIGTEQGLNRYQDGRFTVYTIQDGLSNNVIWSLYQDREGSLWIGTYGGGLNRYKDGKLMAFTTRDGLSNDLIQSIYEDRQGNLWIGTRGGGLNRYKDGRFTAFTTNEGLSNNNVESVYEDREGSLWIGTYGGGLNQYKNGIFTPLSTNEGLSHNFAQSVYEDREGNLWIGTYGGGLNRYKDGKFTTFTTKEGLSTNLLQSLCEDRQGYLWIGTYGGGLNRYKDGKFTAYTTKDGLSSDIIRSLYEDRDGNLWIGTYDGGLNRYKDGKFTTYTIKDGLSSSFVRPLYQDRDGNLWIGTRGGGLNRYRDGKFTIYTTKDGLSSDVVWSLYGDEEGNLWIGTLDGGLNRYRNGKLTAYTTKEGLFDDVVLAILEDGKRNLWMSCNKGIYRVSKKELNDFAAGKIKRIHSISYGTADGMKSRECNGGTQPAGWKAKDGRLWFATIAGVVVIDPEHIPLNELKPPVHVEEVLVDDQEVSRPASDFPVSFPPGKKKFEFHYTATSFIAPERVKFQYKLEGFDEQWIDAGIVRAAYYTNLAPGDYAFRVKACNEDGIWNEEGAAIKFHIAPYFYQTKTFYAVCVLSILLILYSAHRLRLRQLRAGFQLILQERVRISREMHDTITQDFSGIILQLEAAELQAESGFTASLQSVREARELARRGLSESRRFVAALRPDLLEKARLASALTELIRNAKSSCMDVQLRVAGKEKILPRNVEDQLLRIAQEALTNARKHSKASVVEILLDFSSSKTILKISDNGVGFDFRSASAGGGFGIPGMKERAASLKGSFSVESVPGTGTTVIVEVPV